MRNSLLNPFDHFQALSLRQRLGLGMAMIIFPLLMISASGYLFLQYTVHSMEVSFEKIKGKVLPVLNLQELILKSQMPGNDFLINTEAKEIEKFEQLNTDIERAFKLVLTSPFYTNTEREALLQAEDWWINGERLTREIFALPNPKENPSGISLMKSMDEMLQSSSDKLKVVGVKALAEMEHQHEFIHRLQTWVGISISIFLFFLTIIVIVGSSLVRKWIIMPLRELEVGTQHFANGQLDYLIPVRSLDEIGNLAKIANEMATNLKHDKEVLVNLSIHDQLTGLLNRMEFQRLSGLEMARSQRYGHKMSLLMIDVDCFKEVNDNYGHPAGDIVLQTIANRITSILRSNDTLARYGGEEFIVMLPETDSKGSLVIAERLRKKVCGTPINISQKIQPIVTVSVGVATCPDNSNDLGELVAMADQALYVAKNTGRNKCSLYTERLNIGQ